MVNYKNIVEDGKVKKVLRSFPHASGARKAKNRTRNDYDEALEYVPACAVHIPCCKKHTRTKKYVAMAGKYISKPMCEAFEIEELFSVGDEWAAAADM